MTTLLMLAPALIPLLAALLYALLGWRPATEWVGAVAVVAANLGVLWVAMEATTIVTAFLVGQRRGRAAVEAAWKYVVICSTGIALALLGTFLLNFAAQHTPLPTGLD